MHGGMSCNGIRLWQRARRKIILALCDRVNVISGGGGGKKNASALVSTIPLYDDNIARKHNHNTIVHEV